MGCNFLVFGGRVNSAHVHQNVPNLDCVIQIYLPCHKFNFPSQLPLHVSYVSLITVSQYYSKCLTNAATTTTKRVLRITG